MRTRSRLGNTSQEPRKGELIHPGGYLQRRPFPLSTRRLIWKSPAARVKDGKPGRSGRRRRRRTRRS
eukprot:8304251-Pyramimonas_sp.AAC.1